MPFVPSPGRRASVVLAAVLGAALLHAPVQAGAAPRADTWTVTPGGTFSATAPARIKNTTRGWAIDCDSVTFSGSAPNGSGQSRYGLVSVDQATFAGCTGPSGLAFTVTADNPPWDLYADTYDAASGRTTGTLNNVVLRLDASNGCRADVTAPDGAPGSVDAAHTNGDHVLALSGARLGATFTNFACPPSLIATGDTIELATSPPLNPGQTITSP